MFPHHSPNRFSSPFSSSLPSASATLSHFDPAKSTFLRPLPLSAPGRPTSSRTPPARPQVVPLPLGSSQVIEPTAEITSGQQQHHQQYVSPFLLKRQAQAQAQTAHQKARADEAKASATQDNDNNSSNDNELANLLQQYGARKREEPSSASATDSWASRYLRERKQAQQGEEPVMMGHAAPSSLAAAASIAAASQPGPSWRQEELVQQQQHQRRDGGRMEGSRDEFRQVIKGSRTHQ